MCKHKPKKKPRETNSPKSSFGSEVGAIWDVNAMANHRKVHPGRQVQVGILKGRMSRIASIVLR